MIEFNFLYRIDFRLRVILTRFNRSFDHMNILLCDDFAQLSFVDDVALYSKILRFSFVIKLTDNAMYFHFIEIIVFTQIMRQQKESLMIRQFRETLSQLRNDFISQDNWKFLLKRVKNNLSSATMKSFEKTLRLYFRNKKIREYNFTRLQNLNQLVMKIQIKNESKDVKDASWKNVERLNQKLLLSRKSRMMLTWNQWTNQDLINDVMKILYDLIWDQNVRDSFVIMFSIAFVQMNDYIDFVNIDFHDTLAMSLSHQFHQWMTDDVVCCRTQFSLTLTFAITVHKCQNFTMSKMMLKFSRKNDTTDQSYVALSRVRSIDDVLFDSDFSYDRFSVNSSIDTMNRLNEIVKRQKLCAAQNATSAISNATLELALRSFSQFDLSSCINSIHSISSCSIHEIDDVVSSLESDHSLLTDLTHQIIVDVVLSHKTSQLAQVFDVTSKTINLFRVRLIKEENIVRMIDQFSTMTSHDVDSHHAEIVIMKCYSDVYQYDVNLWMLNTFLQKKWLCVFAIDDAILSQFVDATSEIQYVSIAMI